MGTRKFNWIFTKLGGLLTCLCLSGGNLTYEKLQGVLPALPNHASFSTIDQILLPLELTGETMF